MNFINFMQCRLIVNDIGMEIGNEIEIKMYIVQTNRNTFENVSNALCNVHLELDFTYLNVKR